MEVGRWPSTRRLCTYGHDRRLPQPSLTPAPSTRACGAPLDGRGENRLARGGSGQGGGLAGENHHSPHVPAPPARVPLAVVGGTPTRVVLLVFFSQPRTQFSDSVWKRIPSHPSTPEAWRHERRPPPPPPSPPPPGPRALPLFARGGVLWGYIPATSRACHSAVGPALPCTRVSLRPRRAAIKNKPAGRWSSPPCPPPPLPLVASHTSQAPPACPRCPPSAHPVRQHPHPMRAFPCPPAEDGLLAGPGGARVCDEPAAPAQLPFAPEEVRAPRLILGAVK